MFLCLFPSHISLIVFKRLARISWYTISRFVVTSSPYTDPRFSIIRGIGAGRDTLNHAWIKVAIAAINTGSYSPYHPTMHHIAFIITELIYDRTGAYTITIITGTFL